MRQLWAPWRLEYIQAPPEEGCIFCTKPRQGKDEENLIVWRGQWSFVMLNLFPYSSGHVMAVPYRHTADLGGLGPEEVLGLWEAVTRTVRALQRAFRPDGFNVGINLGRAAGAGIEGHLHVHVVPRWFGDTNFMPVLADVKIIPQHLRETYRSLREAFQAEE
ncbi:MAG: HIT domain-containing protein [Armatimonadetes bacterium]|nr:HIT domain-containing protein [Armatimonadota bacterium]MDW8153410.1 HIT domain-containing protein [Armatimonadota bacterium]